LNVDVDVLLASTSKYPVSKHAHPYEYYEHKNHEYSDDTYTAAASAFFGHEVSPYVMGTNRGLMGKAQL
jgi:hypothetical protein